MMKKILSGILCIMLCLGLCACGGGKQAEGQAPTWQEQYDLGLRYLSEGKYTEAVLAFTAAIEIDAKQALAYVGRGDAYVLSGETEENLTAAQADYEQAIGLNEANVEAYLGLADVYIRRGEYDKALELLKQALEATSSNQAIADKIKEMERGNINDSSGKERRRSNYDGDGKLTWWHEYTYNADGTRASATSYDSDGNQTGHVDMVYDAQGRCVVTSHYIDIETGVVSRMEQEFNDQGKVAKAMIYNTDGTLAWYNVYQYDEAGHLSQQSLYNPDGSLSTYYLYEYSSEGTQTKRSQYDSDGVLWWYYTNVYDSDGKITESNTYTPDGELHGKKIYHYNENGKLSVFELYDGEGKLIRSTVAE